MRLAHLKNRFLCTSFAASVSVFGSLQAEVILIEDPPVELTQVLADWNIDRDDSQARWRPRVGSDRSSVANGFIRIQAEGRLELSQAEHPNRYPFVRFRVGGTPQAERTVTVNASPFADENARSSPLPLADGGNEFTLRLPPDKILTKERYEVESLRLNFDETRSDLALDYVMVDSVPTRALAEFDSAFPEPVAVSGLLASEQKLTEGRLQLRYRDGVSLDFSSMLPEQPRQYDALELRLRLSPEDGNDHALLVEWQGKNTEPGSYELTLHADGEFHLYRLHLYKEPSWQMPLSQLSLTFKLGQSTHNAYVEIDSVRLRDFPNPGGGNVSSGLLSFRDNPDDWAETARLLDRWRFVAGQSYKGNLARFWQRIGPSFPKNHIRWETDHPTWQWLIDHNQWPRTPDGTPDLKAAAQLAYDNINPAAQFLEKRGARLDAVHFDGLFKRLLMPMGNSYDKMKSDEGGLFEYAKGDLSEAYRLAAETFCEFLALTRNAPDSALKETRFYIQPNFHVWGWAHGALSFKRVFTRLPDPGNFRDMMDALDTMDRAYKERGAYAAPSPLAGYGADWVFMNPQRRRLTSYEWYSTEVLGKEFNVINNGTLKGDSPEERSQDSLDYLLQFRSEGGRPTSFTPYYWQTTWREAEDYAEDAEAVLPETKPHTVTWAVLQSARLSLYLEPNSIPDPETR